jgi:F-box-like
VARPSFSAFFLPGRVVSHLFHDIEYRGTENCEVHVLKCPKLFSTLWLARTCAGRRYNMARSVELLDFPDEILFSIAEHLDPWGRDLCALVRACIRLSEIAAPYFYRRLVIRTEGQAKRLSNAIQCKRQRSTFIRELILVPDLEPARHIMLDLYWTLSLMDVLQHLMVELPFHESYSAASTLQYRYQERFGEMFKETSLISFSPKSCALRSLRSCEYGIYLDCKNFRGTGFPTCPITKLCSPVQNIRKSPLHFSDH